MLNLATKILERLYQKTERRGGDCTHTHTHTHRTFQLSDWGISCGDSQPKLVRPRDIATNKPHIPFSQFLHI